jgi:hypothetical protein
MKQQLQLLYMEQQSSAEGIQSKSFSRELADITQAAVTRISLSGLVTWGSYFPSIMIGEEIYVTGLPLGVDKTNYGKAIYHNCILYVKFLANL